MENYEPCTTFWQDFTIADRFVDVEKDPIGDTYKKALEYAKLDYKYFTELVLVLNHKCWQHHGEGNIKLSKLYSDLYYKTDDLFYETFEDAEARRYYVRTLD